MSQDSIVGAKRRELATSTYKTTFARDMTINKQYARFQERFGSTPSEIDESQPIQMTSGRRDEDNKADEDMMIESTGMQRCTGVASSSVMSSFQQRSQNLSQNLNQLNSVASDTSNSFKGSFQRAPPLPKPEVQPERPQQLSASAENKNPRPKIKKAQYLSPPNQQEQTVSDIKKRQNARNFISKLEQNLVPQLLRVRADAFDALRDHRLMTDGFQYASVESFGKDYDHGHQDVELSAQQYVTGETAKFDNQQDPAPIQSKNVFQELEKVQSSKFEALGLLPELRHSEFFDKNKKLVNQQQQKSHDFDISDLDHDSNQASRWEEGKLVYDSAQQPMSVDKAAFKAILDYNNEDQMILSPMQSTRAGYQYPSGNAQSQEQDFHRRAPMIQSSAPKMFTNAIGKAHVRLQYELGEAPVSVQPTDYESQVQTLSSDNKTTKMCNNLLDAFQPFQSLNSSEMIAKANRVSQQVNDRMAQVRAMQNDLLHKKKPRDSQSKTSIRSGRQMSDQEFDKLSRELSQSIQLKKVNSSDAGSEHDQQSFLGEDYGKFRNPATIEYFAAVEISPAQKPKKLSKLHSSVSKPSSDFYSINFANPADTNTGPNSMAEDFEDSLSPLQSRPESSNCVQQQLDSQEQVKNQIQDPLRDNRELKKLKLQNALLIISSTFSKHATSVKQVYLQRWIQKIRHQKQILTKLVDKKTKVNSLNKKQAVQEWKIFKDVKLQEEIAEEFNQVQLMQKRLLFSIQNQFTDKCKQNVITRCFKSWNELYNQRKERKYNKIQGTQRLEKVLRRQLRKRQRNFFKAVCQQPFVSDLADEEVFSIMSGKVPSSYSKGKPTTLRNLGSTSPLLQLQEEYGGQLRSSSVRNKTPMTVSPKYERQSRKQQNRSDVEKTMAQIKGAAKLTTISVTRLLNQEREPSVRGLFKLWATRVYFLTKGRQDSASKLQLLRRGLPEILMDFHHPATSPTAIRVNTEQILVLGEIKDTTQLMDMGDNQPQQHETNNKELHIHKQASGTLKQSRSIEEVYMADEAKKSDIPEHEIRADVLKMLDQPEAMSPDGEEKQKVNQQKEKEKEKEKEIQTTSDISSVNLDSDDSCFAAPVEVIKLAPVKKAKELQEPVTLQTSQNFHQEMPKTTNVSQIDQQDQRMMRQSRESDMQVMYDDDEGQEVEHMSLLRNQTVAAFQQQEHISITPQSVNAQPLPSTEQNLVRKVKRTNKNPIRPKFTQSALVTTEERLKVPAKAMPKTILNTPQKTNFSRKNSVMIRGMTSRKLSMAEESFGGKVKLSKQLTSIGQKSNSLANTMKFVSLPQSDPFQRDTETPKFRRSILSNAADDAGIYKQMAQQPRILKGKIVRVPSTRAAATAKKNAPQQKMQLMQKLTKVAEAQIAAEVAMHAERQREKTKRLAKDHERKTSLMFQNKMQNLRGLASARTSVPNNIQPITASSEILSTIKPQQVLSEKSKNATKSVISKQSFSRNFSQKGSFTSQEYMPRSRITGWCFKSSTAPNRSEMASPHRTRIFTKNSKVSSTRVKKLVKTDKGTAKKIDIEACMNNQLKVKMPFLSVQTSMPMSARNSSTVTSPGHDRIYTQLYSRNPPSQQKRQSSKISQKRNIARSSSKGSLRTISDRPLKKTYEPPVYKSRAFRNLRNHNLTTSNTNEIVDDNICESLLKTQPQIVINDDQKFDQEDLKLTSRPQFSADWQHRDQKVETQPVELSNDDKPVNVVFQHQNEQQQIQMTNLIVANDNSIEVLQTAKKPKQVIEHETPDFLTQSQLGRNKVYMAQMNSASIDQPGSMFSVQKMSFKSIEEEKQEQNKMSLMALDSFTLGKQSDQPTSGKKEQNLKMSYEGSGEALRRVDAGLNRLARAITPRLERYKVELFIYLCEMLDENEEEEEEYYYGEEAIGVQEEQVEAMTSSDEDVYGSGKYKGPQRLSNPPQDSQQ